MKSASMINKDKLLRFIGILDETLGELKAISELGKAQVLSSRDRFAMENLKSILKKMGYTFEANPWTFKNTNITLHRLTKIEGEDSLTIDLLVGNEGRHKEIIENAIVEETEYGLTCIASREDLIWMKRFRNSKQDIADIEALENDKNTESS